MLHDPAANGMPAFPVQEEAAFAQSPSLRRPLLSAWSETVQDVAIIAHDAAMGILENTPAMSIAELAEATEGYYDSIASSPGRGIAERAGVPPALLRMEFFRQADVYDGTSKHEVSPIPRLSTFCLLRSLMLSGDEAAGEETAPQSGLRSMILGMVSEWMMQGARDVLREISRIGDATREGLDISDEERWFLRIVRELGSPEMKAALAEIPRYGE